MKLPAFILRWKARRAADRAEGEKLREEYNGIAAAMRLLVQLQGQVECSDAFGSLDRARTGLNERRLALLERIWRWEDS